MDEKEAYGTYMKQLDEIQAAINVYKKGIQDELRELSLIETVQVQLRDALKFVHDQAAIVSIKEYAKLKEDMKTIEGHINKKRSIIKNIESAMLGRNKEVSEIGKKIEELQRKIHGASIIDFHRKKDE